MAFMLVANQLKLSWVPLALGEKAPRRQSAVEVRKDVVAGVFIFAVITLWIVFGPIGPERDDAMEQEKQDRTSMGIEQLEPTP